MKKKYLVCVCCVVSRVELCVVCAYVCACECLWVEVGVRGARFGSKLYNLIIQTTHSDLPDFQTHLTATQKVVDLLAVDLDV